MPSAAALGSKTIDVIGYPCSARGRGLRTAVTAAHYLAARGARVRQLRGTTPATTIDLIRERLSRPDRPEVIACAGGDDLISLVLQAISGTGVALGLLPTGHRDDLAAALGIPLGDLRSAAEVVLAGQLRDIDVGVVGTAPAAHTMFTTAVHIGSDTRLFDPPYRPWSPGLPAALLAPSAQPVRIELTCGTDFSTPTVIETEALLVTVGNIGRTGGKRICPDARLDDGLLDVTVVGSAPRGQTLRLLTALAAGRVIAHPAVTYHQAAAVSVWCPAGSAMVDGTALDARPCTAHVLRGAQAVLVP
ncbi:diacylglycerol/lipid kinase family protein [Nocardia brasiliensis]|uniref:DAGKc domain-containing protein n=1 Tax=Nocardia brasiliensis (strain ATCC 700358 / HUJEG-1) TaxID=1133849 RepID=K0ERG1_NOCB7|nr:diacylglycerol kinase family protein [Nocardia brasiliensis]AFT99643.1 hypothetical protein O3I_008405 [Nocardia brasiliensis ATCC 700358]OCF90577.1 hypothetical protein AW168_11530 [Nocardia brasiliensis]